MFDWEVLQLIFLVLVFSFLLFMSTQDYVLLPFVSPAALRVEEDDFRKDPEWYNYCEHMFNCGYFNVVDPFSVSVLVKWRYLNWTARMKNLSKIWMGLTKLDDIKVEKLEEFHTVKGRKTLNDNDVEQLVEMLKTKRPTKVLVYGHIKSTQRDKLKAYHFVDIITDVEKKGDKTPKEPKPSTSKQVVETDDGSVLAVTEDGSLQSFATASSFDTGVLNSNVIRVGGKQMEIGSGVRNIPSSINLKKPTPKPRRIKQVSNKTEPKPGKPTALNDSTGSSGTEYLLIPDPKPTKKGKNQLNLSNTSIPPNEFLEVGDEMSPGRSRMRCFENITGLKQPDDAVTTSKTTDTTIEKSEVILISDSSDFLSVASDLGNDTFLSASECRDQGNVLDSDDDPSDETLDPDGSSTNTSETVIMKCSLDQAKLNGEDQVGGAVARQAKSPSVAVVKPQPEVTLNKEQKPTPPKEHKVPFKSKRSMIYASDSFYENPYMLLQAETGMRQKIENGQSYKKMY